MAERRKFGLGGVNLNIREPEVTGSTGGESRIQELVNTIENPAINTAFNFKIIPREKLVFHKNNEYPMEALEELAASILDIGLLHNIDVSYDEEKDHYVIDAGERRTRAIDLLIERYKDLAHQDMDSEACQRYIYNVQPFEKGYPCKVSAGSSRMHISDGLDETELKELDDVEAKIRLRVSNELGRKHDPVRTKAALDEIIRLENRRNELLGNGKTISNKEVGSKLNITDRMVQKYKAIDKLIPELRELFEKRGITLADGANYANLSEEEQKQILDLINAGGEKEELAALYSKLKKLQEDMQHKDEELQKLASEKEEALANVDKAKQEASILEEKIRVELQGEADQQGKADQETIKQLQEQLEQVNQNVAAYEKQGKELEAKKKEIEKLQEELTRKDKPLASKENVVVMKAALRVESSIKDVENAIKQLQKAFGEYQKIYDGSESEKAPEEYQKEIEILIEKLK